MIEQVLERVKVEYPAKPEPMGKCHNCGKPLSGEKPKALWCNRQCKDRYYDFPEEQTEPPGIEQLEAWESEGGAEATDGCWVEPDGRCEHGKPSWLLALGLI